MQGSDWKDGIGETEPGDSAISGRVRNTAKGSLPYEIKYRLEAGGDHLLLDPEIIVDGNPEPPPIKKKKKASLKKARRPAKKKSASKIARKSAKKAPAKRKRAQRSRRGKAKKR